MGFWYSIDTRADMERRGRVDNKAVVGTRARARKTLIILSKEVFWFTLAFRQEAPTRNNDTGAISDQAPIMAFWRASFSPDLE